jgi:ABC-type antimicrobial peptide transport system permease subunit
MGASLLVGFGLLALFLTVVGLYGIIAYSVTQRTRDIGIRMALGATPADILWLTLRQGMGPVVAGASVGLLAGYAAMRVAARLLYGISATDPVTFGSALGLLAAIALLAVLVPARRAATVAPTEALRSQ